MLRSLLVAVLILAGCGSGPAPDATGAQIYGQMCVNCHGEMLEGRIGPPLGDGSNAETQPNEFLENTIKRGRGRMPAFRSALTDDQIQRVIQFIRNEHVP